jgi:type IV pilus assembly protein PilA
MRYALSFNLQGQEPARFCLRHFRWIFAATIICLAASAGAAQEKSPRSADGSTSSSAAEAPAQQEMPWTKDLNKYPGLLPELSQLMIKLQKATHFPAMRGQSRLLPLLPESTVGYAAFPNYGDSVHQALLVFQQELKESAVLRDWWQHGAPAAAGPKLEDALEKLYQLSQYLGDEIAVSGSIKNQDLSLLILAEVRKPGLQAFISKLEKEYADKSNPPLRVFDPRQLATAKDNGSTKEPIVLVRPDFVVVAFDLSALRSFNALLDKNAGNFISTPFGQRLAQAYRGGAGILLGVDLQKVISQFPQHARKDQLVFQRTGFADLKYLIWEHKDVVGQAASQAELSFTGPRHGVASWLAAPARVGGLDFVSPKAAMVNALVLKSPAQIFYEFQELFNFANPGAFAGLAQAEEALQFNLKQDLLSKLTGEITAEFDGPFTANPEWKVFLRVNDSAGLQQTLNRLLAAAHFDAQRHEAGGLTYYSFPFPAGPKPVEISYAFVDGYLLVSPSPASIIEADRIHRTGDSLAKSSTFLAALPPGHSAEVSGLFYQNVGQWVLPMMKQQHPEMAPLLTQLTTAQLPSNAVCAYAEESAFREASTSGSFDVAMVLVVAAVAIPNLLRSRILANEASAVGALRTVNVAQVTYYSTYGKGYAPDLATLGPGPGGDCSGSNGSEEHACLIDASLGGAACTSGKWCAKSGFQFSVVATCEKQPCDSFVVVATPVSPNSGARNFCSTAEGVIRFRTGPPLTSPVSASECESWPPIS